MFESLSLLYYRLVEQNGTNTFVLSEPSILGGNLLLKDRHFLGVLENYVGSRVFFKDSNIIPMYGTLGDYFVWKNHR